MKKINIMAGLSAFIISAGCLASADLNLVNNFQTPQLEVQVSPIVSGPAFKRIFIVLFENVAVQDALKQPFMKQLVSQGGYLSNFFAETHPSEPNYVALVSGSTYGISDDGTYNLPDQHIGDLLEAKGHSWKSYLEDYPGNCFAGSSSGEYVRKHSPFISFTNVSGNKTRCNAHLVNSSALDTDIQNGTLPDYAFYAPGLKNDGHDTDIQFADQWLSSTFGPRLNDPKFIDGTLFVVTFDEDDGGAGNQIYTVMVGAGVKLGTTSSAIYNHYSILRLVENNFSLGNLGTGDVTAAQISSIWSQ